MRHRIAVGTVCLLLVSACGSTVEDGEETVAPSTSVGSAVTEPDAPNSIDGVDDATVKIGFIVAENQAEAQAKLGTTGITFVDHRKVVASLVDDVNVRGGLGGKEIVPVMYVSDLLTDTDPDANARAICATFTEDNEVYAVLSINDPGPEVLSCLNAAGVPLIASSGATFSFSDQSVYDANPLYFNPSGINLDRAAKALVEGLDSVGFFTSDAKVGLVRLTSPEFDAAAANSLEPALTAAGVAPVETVALAAIASNDDIGRFSTEAAAAVLKMKEAGVTHLVFFESGGAAPFFFLSNATSQGFEPLLGFSSLSGGQTLLANIKTGGINVAWSPNGEVLEADQLPESPAATKCLDLVDSTRGAFTSANATSETLRFCDAVWLLETGVTSAGGPVAATELATAIEGLGDTYDSPAALKTVFGPGRHDGVAEYYITEFDSACSCNKYRAGDPTPIG